MNLCLIKVRSPAKCLCCCINVVNTGDPNEKLKLQQTEAARRENVLVMRLASKEQEMQDYLVSLFGFCNLREH